MSKTFISLGSNKQNVCKKTKPALPQARDVLDECHFAQYS